MEQEIIDFICDYRELDPKSICPDSSLVSDCGLGSFDIVELCCQLEEKYEVCISEDDIMKLKTIHDLSEYILNKR